MRIMNVKRAIIILLAIGLMAVVSGCARWPEGPEPEPGEENYQLEITVEVNEEGTINTDDGIYYIVFDADGDSATGPGSDILLWDDEFYYVKLENGFFSFAKVEEGSSGTSLTSNLIGEKSFQVTIALSDLGVPSDIDFSIDINAVTTDSEGDNYDHLDSYFTIRTDWGSVQNKIDSSGDSGDGGVDFDIINVTAEIITL
jgi:hypothetical protein